MGVAAEREVELWELVPGCHVNKLSLREESPQEVEVMKIQVHVELPPF